jgi:hypothetical protein
MLGKTSVSMMVLLVVAASLIGISSIYQYEEGQTPPTATSQPQQQASLTGAGTVKLVRMFDSPAGKLCTAGLTLQGPNTFGLKAGTDIDLLAPSEHFCTLFVLSKIGKIEVGVTAQKITASSLPPAIRGAFTPATTYPLLYRVSEVDI